MSKFKPGDNIRHIGTGNRYTIKEIKDLYYVNGFGDHMDMSYTDANFELVEDPKPSTPDEALDKAAEEYVQTLADRADENLRIDTTLQTAFKAGAKWMARQGFVIQGSCTNSDGGFGVGVVAYNNDEHHTTSCLVPSGMFNYGDKVIVQIRKATGNEKKDTIEELIPRNLLTEDQIKEMNGFEYKTDAIKYINSVSNVGLKVSATYYELYNDKNLEDDDNRRES